MNWKSITLKSLGWRVALLGAAAGMCGGLLYLAAETLATFVELGGFPPPPSTPPTSYLAPLWQIPAEAALGLAVGALLASVDDLLYGKSGRAWRSALLGGLLGGMATGLLGTGLVPAPLDALTAMAAPVEVEAGVPWAAWPVLAAMLGLSAGIAGAVSGRGAGVRLSARMVRRLVLGLVTGALLGAGVALAAATVPMQGWGFLAAMMLWGALTALVLSWWDKVSARRWLRLLTPPGDDRIFPLRGDRLTLGTHDFNDIPLKHFREVYPFHCHVEWSGDQYRIIDNEQGGIVLVNYRQIEQQVLKAGDLVKIGSAVLQYGETQ